MAVLSKETTSLFPNSPSYAVYILYSPPFPGRSRKLGELFGSVPEGLDRIDLLYGAGDEPANANTYSHEARRETLFPRRPYQVHFASSAGGTSRTRRTPSPDSSSTSASPQTASEGRGSGGSLPSSPRDDNVEPRENQAAAPNPSGLPEALPAIRLSTEQAPSVTRTHISGHQNS